MFKFRIFRLENIVLVVCLIVFRFWVHVSGSCLNDYCRHAYNLVEAGWIFRVERIPYFIFHLNELIFFYIDIFILFYVIRNRGLDCKLRTVVLFWSLLPSYDFYFLVCVILFLNKRMFNKRFIP